MCRHLAFLGSEERLGALLVTPEHSLYRQSWAPRRQRYGTVNADGFGVGWYAEGDPAREAGAAPFTAGPWLFCHNGAVRGWPDTLAPLVVGLPPAELLSLEARCDSAFVWALVLRRLLAGDQEGHALADTVLEVAEAAPGSRLNLLLTNGETITATAWGDTLWYLTETGRRTVVASEPYDDDPLWREVPDRTLLTANRTEVLLTPLKDMSDDMASAQHKEPRT
jgi:glutamine amidotransferase